MEKFYTIFKLQILTLLLLTSTVLSAQVGIGTTSPTETLDVVGNVKFSGALMPNNVAGNAKQLLLSEGIGTPPSWGLQLLNTTQTTKLGKYFSGLFSIPGTSLTLTLTDPNCIPSSTCSLTWINLTPSGPPGPTGPDWEELSVTITAQAGQWIFYIKNNTGYSLSNMQFSFFAAY